MCSARWLRWAVSCWLLISISLPWLLQVQPEERLNTLYPVSAPLSALRPGLSVIIHRRAGSPDPTEEVEVAAGGECVCVCTCTPMCFGWGWGSNLLIFDVGSEPHQGGHLGGPMSQLRSMWAFRAADTS